MPLAEKHYGYVTPTDRVRYGDDMFEPPPPVVPEHELDGVKFDIVERFHAIVEELTDELMAAGDFDRASCRADAILMLTKASERLRKKDAPESPLAYLLREEQQRAVAALGAPSSTAPQTTFLKA